MKRLTLITASCLCAFAYTSTATAVETAANTANEALDPAVSGMLPGDDANPAAAQDPTADNDAPAESAPSSNKRSAKNAIYLDLGGPGLMYSINYDRMITDDVSARIGLSYLSLGASTSDGSASAEFSYMAIPLTVSYLGIGSASNIFELGGGGVLLNITGSGIVDSGADSAEASASVTSVAATGMAGYRHQDPDGGFVFRIGASPLIITTGDFLPWAYMSLGAGF